MKYVIASATMAQEAIDLKDQILEYLQEKNIDILDGGPNILPSYTTPEYMQNAAQLLVDKKVDKVINVCRGAVSAVVATKMAGVPDNLIAQQGVLELKDIKLQQVLTVGFNFNWENTKSYIDTFINNEYK